MEIESVLDAGVALVTLNAPERRNALTPGMAQELIEVLDRFDADPSVAALVLTGAGKGFCSGADLSTLGAAGDDPLSDEHYLGIGGIYAAFQRFGTMGVPTIAAVNGAAVGAGLNLALAADLRIVADDARLMSGFLRIGAHPGGGHLHLLDRLVGRDTTAALAVFGEELNGPEAVRLGLAWRSLPQDQIVAEALRLAARVTARPELTRSVTRTLRLESPSAMSWEAAIAIERAPQLRSFRQRSS
jgi:enoyl-CoA hydratase